MVEVGEAAIVSLLLSVPLRPRCRALALLPRLEAALVVVVAVVVVSALLPSVGRGLRSTMVMRERARRSCLALKILSSEADAAEAARGTSITKGASSSVGEVSGDLSRTVMAMCWPYVS